jgi:hypothetical protein
MTAQRTTSMRPEGNGTAATTGREKARTAWHRIGEAIREMNYAASRIAEPAISGRPPRP